METPNMQQEMNNTEMPISEETSQRGGFGPVIGILVIVALIAFGGLYFWGSSNSADNPADTSDNFELLDTAVEDGGTITEEEFNALMNQSAAAGAVDPTLDNALDNLGDLDALDAELDALGAEL